MTGINYLWASVTESLAMDLEGWVMPWGCAQRANILCCMPLVVVKVQIHHLGENYLQTYTDYEGLRCKSQTQTQNCLNSNGIY